MGCLISSFATVSKITQVCLNKSFSTGNNLNLLSHILDFSIINKKFIYHTLGIHPLVQFKKINLKYLEALTLQVSLFLHLVFNFIYLFVYLFYKGCADVKDKWKSNEIFKILSRWNLEQHTYLCTFSAVQG